MPNVALMNMFIENPAVYKAESTAFKSFCVFIVTPVLIFLDFTFDTCPPFNQCWEGYF